MKTKIIIVGKAGAGKDFLRNKMCSRGFVKETSYTTRPPREGEKNGEDYIFVSERWFLENKDAGFFYEAQEFNGWHYGTSKEQWKMKDIFIMTPSGVSKIKKEDRENCYIIFLDIPSQIRYHRIKERLGNADSINRRMKADDEDFKDFKDYDLCITNSNF